MKSFAYPTTGTLDETFTPHVDCTMKYTEQLSYFFLKLYGLANSNEMAVTTMELSEEETPHDFMAALALISTEIGTVNDTAEDINTAIEALPTSLAALDDLSSVASLFYSAYDQIIDDSDPEDILDGIADLVEYAGTTQGNFFSWLASAFTAFEAEETIPALPGIVAILRFVPAKWALVAKLALAVIPQLLMSYLKGRLEHPDANVNVQFDALIETMEKCFLNVVDEPLLLGLETPSDMVVEFIDSNEKRVRVYPGWNVVEMT